jgi:hypothetical protein
MVRVMNVVNGKQVLVRINDRGPYVNGRILDLSYAAAQRLALVENGTAPVSLEVIGQQNRRLHLPFERGGMVVGALARLEQALGFSDRRAGKSDDRKLVPGESRPARGLRLFLGDMMLQRRDRRAATLLAAEEGAHALPLLHALWPDFPSV